VLALLYYRHGSWRQAHMMSAAGTAQERGVGSRLR
jgi:hypothetical protein